MTQAGKKNRIHTMSNTTYNILKQWGLTSLPDNETFCLAGPCAAESETQVIECASALKRNGISAFRAGIWKPRTRPGAFEGFGAPALEWLKAAKQATGLKTAVEVATPSHVEMALNADVDILWLGARTSTNPFLVQDLANSLKGTDKIVFVKNPINPDLNLWIGAMERILGANIKKCGAILRGFSSNHPGELRNDPGWHIAIDFRQRMPNIPLICDPSHITGRRDRIQQISQIALNLDFDGLFIEVHPTPNTALSDAKQQLTPADFTNLLDNLAFRQHGSTDLQDIRLNALRAQIDELDYEILAAIAKRFNTVEEIGRIKQKENLTILQSDRWRQVLENMLKNGVNLGLDKELVEQLAHLLHQHSIDLQQEILND